MPGHFPDVLLIGAQKSGTTSLAYLLDQHPSISVSDPKEPHFFTQNFSNGKEWYKQRFNSGNESICIDASTSYSMAPIKRKKFKEYHDGVPKKVYEFNPHAKLIYILRNPVERIYSGYWHDFRVGRNRSKSFSELIRDPNYIHMDISDYYNQIQLWLQYYPLENFLFLKFEDFKRDYDNTIKKCFDFLGLDYYKAHLGSPKNQSYYPSFMAKQLNSFSKNLAVTKVKRYIPNSILPKKLIHKLKKGKKEIPEMEIQDKEYLYSYFLQSNKKLEKITGLPLNDWGI